MSERAADDDSTMELLVDLREDRSVDSPERRPSLKGSVLSDSLLAPDTDFMTDGRSSGASGLDVVDRLTYLEHRLQMQEDEIQLLKMALSDVLKRLDLTEGHQAPAPRRVGATARPVSLTLPNRPAMKKSSTAPSAGPGRTYSPTPSSSSVKDSPRARPPPTRKPQDSSKPKEAAPSLGTRRVTHCKVTMQIYLSPQTKKTGFTEAAESFSTVTTKDKTSASAPAPPNRPGAKTGSGGAKGAKKKEKFTLNLQKTSSSTAQDTPSYHSPVKSPSQYFQICY